MQQELQICGTLGSALIALKGLTAPEVTTTYARMREICQQGEATLQLIPALTDLLGFYMARAEWQTARELAELLLSLARRINNRRLLEKTYYALGAILFCLEPQK
jgi:hypothetical protein